MQNIKLVGVAVLMLSMTTSMARADIDVAITYLRQEVEQPPTLSNLDLAPDDLGVAGATSGLTDINSTGQFLGHTYTLDIRAVEPGGDLTVAAVAALSATPFLILDAPADRVLHIADLPEAEGAIIFNVAAPDTRLRDADCRANVLHTLPSNAMRADALMQYLSFKRLTRLAMLAGGHPGDLAFSDALRASAAKFGLKIGAEKSWIFDADMRRSAAQEVPLFTQELGEYDMLLLVDELDDFGRYVAYNTWLPRPVAGSEGLVPTAWSPAVEQWGAAQLQKRFAAQAGRGMSAIDFAAWAAVRTLGEAVTRTGVGDAAALREYMLSDQFELDGFKGRPMTYRDWNGQMRQPIPLVTPRALVAQAPLEGFLHQRSELDTLGIDAPETTCTAFEDGQ